MSHREYLTRLAWIAEHFNDPDRSDYYLMQIAQEIRRVLSKNPRKIKLKDFKMKFEDTNKAKKEATSKSKSIWMSALGFLNRKN